MNNQNVIRILNIVAVVAGTVGGASTVPGLNLPAPILAYGLFVALVCKAVVSELVQVKGQSDEAQGITPQQSAAVAAIHQAANRPPASSSTAAPK